MAHAKSTASLASVQRTLDVVLEQSRHAVVGEAFAQFDDSDKPSREGEVLRDVTQRLVLIIIRFLAIRGGGEGLFGLAKDLTLFSDGSVVNGIIAN
jgi:hypothetical protein